MESVTWEEATARRLDRMHLRERVAPERMLEVAADLGGVHAQLMSSAELTLWARVRDITLGDVREALWRRHELVKTWAMRGTLHLVATPDYPTWQAALSLNRRHLSGAWLKFFGLTAETFQALDEAVGEALRGRCLTRVELAAEVARITGRDDLSERLLSGWGSLLKPSAFAGKLCFGPNQGQNVTFVHPQDWLGRYAPPDADEALREVTRRFLRTFGPATREEVGRWWGADPPAAGRMLQALGGEIEEVALERRRAWRLVEPVAGAPVGSRGASAPVGSPGAGRAATAAAGPLVRLLPAFDIYVVTASPRTVEAGILPAALREQVYRKSAWFSPVLLVDGRMEAVWGHEVRGRKVEVRVRPFAKLAPAVRRGVERETELLARFLGGEPALVVE
ncbi:MAG TPA: winged helix DNA-binding domain-containing protein [Candidatus Dormibacteraeota bacterium]|nr:winged helix DNA-binding domain-containing protein [Candidatus Dormibacteraeota bacterium]